MWISFCRHLNRPAHLSLVKSASGKVKQALRCALCEQERGVGALQEGDERPAGALLIVKWTGLIMGYLFIVPTDKL